MIEKGISFLIYSNYFFYKKISSKNVFLSSATYIIDFALLFFAGNLFVLSRVFFGRMSYMDVFLIAIVLGYIFYLGKYLHKYLNRVLFQNRERYKYLESKNGFLLFTASHSLIFILFATMGYIGIKYLSVL